ncbi:MAG: F0F1 ATP synthase subunit A [Lentimicrobiaceae bacterium]|nr:F0F1 ATP synthase subunit A [Lentimicrobiaceae bacterium]
MKNLRKTNTAKYLLLLLIFCSISLGNISAQNPVEPVQNVEEEFNAGEMIIGHIVDAHEWHILSYKDFHLTIPLPIILYDQGKIVCFSSSKFNHGHSYNGYKLMTSGEQKGKIVKVDENDNMIADAKIPLDFSITKNVVGIFVAAILLMVIFISVAKRYKGDNNRPPKGLQSFLEPIVLFVRDDVVKPSIGEDRYQKFLPFLLTLFFFILFSNILGLIPIFPGGANVTGSMSVTFVLAMFTFFVTNVFGSKAYWKDIVNTPGVPIFLKVPIPLMPIIEIIGLLTKPIVLMVRLFANITAGHIIILGFISIIFLFGANSPFAGVAVSPLSIIFSLFISALEILVAFIQAYVFTLLSSIYIGISTESHNEHIEETAK